MQLPSKEQLGVTDDFVEYRVFPVSSLHESSDSQILLDLRTKYLEYVEKYTKDYIWQRDRFDLDVWNSDRFASHERKGSVQSWPAHLYGRIRYGDNIEDEWYIVFMLLELSSSFLDIVIRYVLCLNSLLIFLVLPILMASFC